MFKITTSLVEEIVSISKEAGDLVMKYYNLPDCEIERKSDNSPVTIADKEASQFIVSALCKLDSKIPVISEELSYEDNLEKLKNNRSYWLVDPIDGTWSFIKKNGSFTVNIALVVDGTAVLGAIYCPLDESTYYNIPGEGSFKTDGIQTIQIYPKNLTDNGYDFLVSSQNINQKTTDYLNNFKINTITPIPSSIKLCLLCDGEGDIYPRFKPTYIWDTAAGHAILSEVGGEIYNTQGKPLTYNIQLENPDFIAVANKSYFIKT